MIKFSGFKLNQKYRTLCKQFYVYEVHPKRGGSVRQKTELYIRQAVLIFGELILSRQELEKFTPWAVLEHEVELFLILEAGDHFNEERMTKLC